MQQAKSDIVIVCFSRTGHSKRLAERLSHALSAEVVTLTAPAYPPTTLGFLRAGFHSLRQRQQAFPDACKSLSQYEHLILCGPVWTSYPSLPLRSVLRGGGQLPHKVSLFLTSGDPKPQNKAFEIAEADLGRKVYATASLGNGNENTDVEERTISAFVDSVLNGGGKAALTGAPDAALAAST